MLTRRRLSGALLVALVAAGLAAAPAEADHSWGGYHWARPADPFTLALGDNLTSTWDSYLATTSGDWSESTVLDTTIVAGGATGKNGVRRCPATAGRVEVCSYTYGRTGWLGVASVSVSGSHITAGTVKLNDTYYNTATYDTPAWRNLVMCQEVGHTLGLHHQDEDFDNANLGTCMDYTSSPGTNQHPNAHDYAQLEAIYGHGDTTTTVGSSAAAVPAAFGASVSEWGRAVRTDGDGRPSLFVRDLGPGTRVFTFVTWAR